MVLKITKAEHAHGSPELKHLTKRDVKKLLFNLIIHKKSNYETVNQPNQLQKFCGCINPCHDTV